MVEKKKHAWLCLTVTTSQPSCNDDEMAMDCLDIRFAISQKTPDVVLFLISVNILILKQVMSFAQQL